MTKTSKGSMTMGDSTYAKMPDRWSDSDVRYDRYPMTNTSKGSMTMGDSTYAKMPDRCSDSDVR